MIIPPALQPGDEIGITCPSGYLPLDRTTQACQILGEWGYTVQLGATVGSEHFYFSETDERRKHDLQAMLDDPNIKAILMGRGGYGLSRIIDQIDFSAFRRSPKWVCGFSDITVLHSHIHATMGIATMHSPMCNAFTADTLQAEHILFLKEMLSGHFGDYTIPAHPCNRKGLAKGAVVGGNLAILAHLSGSVSQMDTRGKILFIEDVGEYLYNADRMLFNIKRAGMLDNLAGLICGSFTDMQDTERPFGQDIYEIIYDKVREYRYPVCFDFPAGHSDINYPIVLGTDIEMRISDTESFVKY